ncbi:MAG: hypothetical protein C0484_05225 [Rhodospirillum sp.]|nr:hypothetical protein [Rhodospirillum sp.]
MTIINFKNRSTAGFDEDALFISAGGEQVLNFGKLTTTGDLAEGIFAAADDVTIRNFGRVETNGLGAVGILVLGDDARIENYGSVTTRGGHLDFEFFSEGILAIGDRFHIANYGTVRVEGEFSSGIVGVGNDGWVVNYGRVDCLSASGVLGAVGDNSRAINAGQLTTREADATALFAIGEDALALNLGRIEIDAAASLAMRGTFANTQVVNAGVISISASDCVGMLGIGDGHQLRNSGLIDAHGTFSTGMGGGSGPPGTTGSDLEIVNVGRISTDGDLGIGMFLGVTPFEYRPAFDGIIVNRGTIETEGDGAAGVFVLGDGHHVTNNGRISTDGGVFDRGALGLVSAAGVIVSGDQAVVENTRSGLIRSEDAASAAVELNVQEFAGAPAADLSARLENFGLIRGAGIAILGGAGEETVINHGRIVGDVVLGDGADNFVFGKGGTLAGDLLLGDGDDFVLIENGAGKISIADFSAAGGDVVDVSAFFSGFDDLTDRSRQNNGDVVIDLDHNDRLLFANVQLTALNAGDFVFS